MVGAILRRLGKPDSLIDHVADRKGHDLRYAIDPAKIHRELGWLPATDFDSGIASTIDWYVTNRAWWERILDGSYRQGQ